MFVVLNTVQAQKKSALGKIMSKLMAIFRHAKTSVREARAGNIKYFIIDTELKNGKIEWNKVYNVAGREASRLIIPEGINPPRESHVKAYDSSKFILHVFYNTIFSILKNMQMSPDSIVIGIYDPYAKAAEVSPSFLKYCRHLKVVTDFPDKYYEYSEKAMSEYGAGIIVSDTCYSFENCNIIIAPFGMAGCNYYPHNALVFDIDGICGYSVTNECIKLPKIYTRELPPRVSEAAFAAALYERARVKQIGNIIPKFMVINGRKMSLYDILANIPQPLVKSNIKIIS